MSNRDDATEEPSDYEVDAPDADFGDEDNKSADQSDVQGAQSPQDDPGEGSDRPGDRASDEEGQPQDDTSGDGDTSKDGGKDADEAVVELDNGEKYTLKEIQDGMMMQSDYTKKTQEVAEGRKSNEEFLTKLKGAADESKKVHEAIMKWANDIIPPEPGLDLLQKDPKAYQFQKERREKAQAELNKHLEETKIGVPEEVVKEALERAKSEETSKLQSAMPELRDSVKMTSFMTEVKNAAKEFGFSEEEAEGTFDHRVLQILHYAKIGKNAKSVESEGKPRTDSPRKTRGTGNRGSSKSNVAALNRLNKTGSIDDAMAVNFDFDAS